MRIFVSEYLCSGAWPGPELPPSLAREGRAMLLALLADLAALPEVTLCTTWDARLGAFPLPTTALPLPRGQCHSLKSLQSGERAGVRGAAGNIDSHPLAEPVALAAVADGSPLNIECSVIVDPGDEAAVFERLAGECDATYVIAPELDDLLTRRVRSVLDAGGRSLNASTAAIATCSDKWETFQRLSAAGIATVPTALFDPDAPSLPFESPLVLKPRCGAGSQETFLICNASELEAVSSPGGRGSRRAASHGQSSFASGSAGASPSQNVDSNLLKPRIRRQQAAVSSQQNPESDTSAFIAQPYIAGRSLSVAAIFRSDGSRREVWPVGEQRLSTDGRFSYLGGRLPAERIGTVAISAVESGISDLISQITNQIPGLRGYIGFDLILPDGSPETPLIVDINPRLTTSYLGYRALSRSNLAERVLWPDADRPPVDWDDAPIDFDAGGAIARSSASRG